MDTRTATGQPDRHRPAIGTILYMLFGPLVWAAHLMLIYGPQSIACGFYSSPRPPLLPGLDLVQTAIAAASVISLAIVAVPFVAGLQRRPPTREDDLDAFLGSTMRLLAVLSALGIAAAGATALVLPTCLALR